MYDFEARHMMEALRSGIASRSVGAYFSSSRPEMVELIGRKLEDARKGMSGGLFFSGSYGTGKTHMLNTAFAMASDKNMVVSIISISKETPVNNLKVLYGKLMENTYLPGEIQPGFMDDIGQKLWSDPDALDFIRDFAYNLGNNRFGYALDSFLDTMNTDGNDNAKIRSFFSADSVIDSELKTIFNKSSKAKGPVTFTPKKGHDMDYFYFMSALFKAMGYSGWLILLDEAELIARYTVLSRRGSYLNLSSLLYPEPSLMNTCTLVAITPSYVDEILNGKDEENLIMLSERYDDIAKDKMLSVLNDISEALELKPLSEAELIEALRKLVNLHGRAYDWIPSIDIATLYSITSKGDLLRSKMRLAIEKLDNLLLYKDQPDEEPAGNMVSLDNLFSSLI